jgi:DNA-binding CsgD family transcriptional regulator
MRRGRPRHQDVLTPREWQVLDLLRQGLTNDQIAAGLGISLDTAKFHVSEILTKLGVQTRQQAAAWQGRPRGIPATGLPAAIAGKIGALSPLKLAGAAVIAAAALGLAALAAGLLLADSGPPAEDASSDVDTGDEALDAIIESLLNDDASQLAGRFDGLIASEGVFNVGGVGPPNLPSTDWTARLAAAERSLYAAFQADPQQDENRPWSRDVPFIRSACGPRGTPGCLDDPADYPAVYFVLAVEIDSQQYGWRFGVRDGRVTGLTIPSLGAPDELRLPSSFIPRQPGEDKRYLVLPPKGPTRQDIEAFRLEEAQGALEFAGVQGDQFPSGPGVYFLDVQTGAVEGWHLPAGQPYSGIEFALSGDNRFLAARVRYRSVLGQQLLADRTTSKVYRWPGNAQLLLAGSQLGEGRQIAAGGSRVIFRFPAPYPNSSGEDWFAIVDMDPQPRTIATFRAIGTASELREVQALLSSDGQQVAVFGDVASIVDLRTGTSRRIDSALYESVDPEASVTIQNTGRGEAFLFTATPAKEEYPGVWLHYGWDGNLVAEGTSARGVYSSPSGDVLATFQPLLPGSNGMDWYVLNAVDTRNGSPLFRVVGVRLGAGPGSGNRWLSDDSGVVVSGISTGTSIAMRDRTFRPYLGVPSPASTALFALGAEVVDGTGRTLAKSVPPDGTHALVSPWGATDAEIRFFTPHLGSDGGGAGGQELVETYVERPPYQEPPRLQLNDAAAGAELRDAAAGGSVVANLAAPLRVVVHEAQDLVTGPGAPGYALHCDFLSRTISAQEPCAAPLIGLWVRVTAESGASGWLLLSVIVVP